MPATIALKVSGVTSPAQKSSQSAESTSGVPRPVARVRSWANEAPRSWRCSRTFLTRASLSEGGAHSRRATRLARGAVEHRPDHLARQPQTIEPLPLVVLHAGGQEVLL